MLRRLGFLAALLAFSLACTPRCRAADAASFNGTWSMQLAGHTFLVLNLVEKGEHVSGSFESPASFNMTNSVFSVQPGAPKEGTVDGQIKEAVLHLTVHKNGDPSNSIAFAMSVRGDQAQLVLEGMPAGATVPPWMLNRAPQDTKVFTDWNPSRGYTMNDSDTPNARMQALYDEDQADRKASPIDWSKVSVADKQRRVETRGLLDAGELHTGQDFREAAFIFQHGDSSSDYLLAHVLAMTAMSKGDAESSWIAAATLDRYLQSQRRSQIFGTQRSYEKNGAMSATPAQPYDSKLIPAALANQFGKAIAPSNK